MPRIQLKEIQMNVDIVPGVAPVNTLFIHGNLASNAWWNPAFETWTSTAKPDQDGSLVAGEWRGCGDSEAPRSADDLHPAVLANDYIELCRSLDVKQARRKTCLVGHSTGGLIALYALIQAPALFDRAVLLDPVGATGAQFGPEMYDAFTRMSEIRSICEAIMGGTIHGCNPQSPLFQKIVDDAFRVSKINWHGVPKALHGIDITQNLAELRHPILVLHGALDPIIPVESSKVLAAGLPNAQLDIVGEHGHSLNVENPVLFTRKVNEFLFNRS